MVWRDQWISRSDYNRKLIEGGIMFMMIVLGMAVILSLYSRSSGIANRLVCASHLRSLSQALSMYAQDNDGGYPPERNWAISLVSYVDSLGSYTCPSDPGMRPRKKTPEYSISSVSYWYIMPKANSGDESAIPVHGDRVFPNYSGNHDDGANVVYLDGHTRWRTPEQWEMDGLPFESYGGGLIKK